MKSKTSLKTIFLLILITLFFAGCATPYDVDVEKENTRRVTNHNINQTNQTMYRVQTISDIANGYDCADPESKDCGAIQAVMRYRGFEAVERTKGEQYAGPVGRSGVDVQYKVAENGVPIAAITGTTITTTAAVKEKKGSVNNTVKDGGTINNTNDEDKLVNVGDESSPVNQPDQDNSTVEEAKVE